MVKNVAYFHQIILSFSYDQVPETNSEPSTLSSGDFAKGNDIND